jgi:hypothetical protein
VQVANADVADEADDGFKPGGRLGHGCDQADRQPKLLGDDADRLDEMGAVRKGAGGVVAALERVADKMTAEAPRP